MKAEGDGQRRHRRDQRSSCSSQVNNSDSDEAGPSAEEWLERASVLHCIAKRVQERNLSKSGSAGMVDAISSIAARRKAMPEAKSKLAAGVPQLSDDEGGEEKEKHGGKKWGRPKKE